MKTTVNEHGTTVAIGEDIKCGLITVTVVKVYCLSCEGCVFSDYICSLVLDNITGRCEKLLRTDNEDVIFKLKQ